MKKFIILLLVATVVVAAGFADPIGLKVYIDGFGFGNVAADNYELAGKTGQGNIVPGVEYNKGFGAIALNTSLQDTIKFTDPLTQDTLRWHVKGTYALQVAEASKLSFFLYNRLHFKGENEEFANTDYDQITDNFGPGIRFDQTLDFGGLYAEGGVDFKIHTLDGQKLEVGTSDTDHIVLGVSTKFGLYGRVQIVLKFVDATGETPSDGAFTNIRPRIGYVYGPIDGRVTFDIPTKDNTKGKGIEGTGIKIEPRVTYNNIVPGLAAYANFAITGVGAKDPVKIGFEPTIGVSYAF